MIPLRASGPPIRAAEMAARRHQESLAIPRGSLGRLHDIGIQLAAITGDARPVVETTGIITMAGDHGVAAQGVSCFPQEVTREMVANFIRGGAAINVLADVFDSRLTVVDIGVAGEPTAAEMSAGRNCRLVNARIADGTADMTQGRPCRASRPKPPINTGIRVFIEEHKRGLDAVGTGDMGIANTTASAAIACVLLGCPPEKVVNRGTGIDDDTLSRKVSVVEQSLKVHRPDPEDALDLLAKVGGFEIGGIAGVISGGLRPPHTRGGRRLYFHGGGHAGQSFQSRTSNIIFFPGTNRPWPGTISCWRTWGSSHWSTWACVWGRGPGPPSGLAVLKAASRVACRVLTFEEARVTGPGTGDR